jgi:hypothetical protein
MCQDPPDASKLQTCNRLTEQFDAALVELRADRVSEARRALQAIVRAAEEAGTAGALSSDERALIVGGARRVMERL